MNDVVISPEDFKLAIEALWQTSRELENKAGKDVISLRYAKQDQDFVHKMMAKYPALLK